jgi:hypothetical protein
LWRLLAKGVCPLAPHSAGITAEASIGLRGDIRYLRSFEDPDEDNEFDPGVGNFDDWRAAGGLTFRWQLQPFSRA